MLSFLVITVDGVLRPGYSPVAQVISDLGVGRHAWVLNTDLIVTGLLIMLFALGVSEGLGNALGRRRAIATAMLLVLAGAGIANDGVFTEFNPANPHATLHDRLHTIGFYVAFGALIIVFLVVGLRLRTHRAWRRYGWYSVATGLVLVALILLPFVLPAYGAQAGGLNERVIVVAAFGWQGVTGYLLLRPQRRRWMLTTSSAAAGGAANSTAPSLAARRWQLHRPSYNCDLVGDDRARQRRSRPTPAAA